MWGGCDGRPPATVAVSCPLEFGTWDQLRAATGLLSITRAGVVTGYRNVYRVERILVQVLEAETTPQLPLPLPPRPLRSARVRLRPKRPVPPEVGLRRLYP